MESVYAALVSGRSRRNGGWLLAVAGLAGLLLGAPPRESPPAEETPARAGRTTLEDALRTLAQGEYAASENARGLQAPNRAQGLRTYFRPGGIEVHDRVGAQARLLSITLTNLGRAGERTRVPEGTLVSTGTRVEIRRPGLVEWFENSPHGLEQGFTLPERIRGDGPLELDLVIDAGTLVVRGDDIVIETPAGRALRYGALHTVDADRRPVPSHFEVVSADTLRIVVDDANARYPIVIDPLLSSTTDAFLEAEQDGSRFGDSLASAGDVNGDGFDDVIIGASRYDDGQPSEGAAFVFLGSATGLVATRPSDAIRLRSEAPDTGFGHSVASAGDVNADGFDDVIVSAPDGSPSVAYVFHGSDAGLASTDAASADARITPDPDHFARVGDRVAAAGDVNGDGFDDVLVGVRRNAGGGADVLFGSALGVTSRTLAQSDAVLRPAANSNPDAIAGAGDVNGDGFADLILGYPGGSDRRGKVFVFHGAGTIGEGVTLPVASHLEPIVINTDFGRSVAGAGDVNGDGFGDVVVGAPRFSDGETGEGAIFVFHGGPEGLPSGDPNRAQRVVEAEMARAALGASVAAAGDVNRDGYGDIVVGMTGLRLDPRSVAQGAGFVLLGGASGITAPVISVAEVRLTPGTTTHGEVGMVVAGAGDIDGDGYADVLIGEPERGDPFTRGGVHVFHGGPWAGETFLGVPGAAIANAGDVNGDGFDELIAGHSRVFMFHGGIGGIPTQDALSADGRIDPPGSSNLRFAGIGDVNGDGFEDLAVAVAGYDTGADARGAVFVFHGASGGIGELSSSDAVTQLVPDWTDFEYPLMEIAGAGDVDDDGYADLLIGATGVNVLPEEFETRGEALLFRGAANGIASGSWATADTRIAFPEAFVTRIYVAGVGDVNGDGWSDVALGVPTFYVPPSSSGAVLVFNGGPNGITASSSSEASYVLHQVFEFTVRGDFGKSLDGAGDVNGDGYDDIIVGSPLYDTLPFRDPVGAVSVFHGGPDGFLEDTALNAPGRITTSRRTDGLGESVAGVGDVNGDGFADVIVGVPTIGDPGSAHFFYGGPDGIGRRLLSESDRVVELENPGWGAHVAGGDFNGDGYGDAAIAGSSGSDSGVLVLMPEPGARAVLGLGLACIVVLARTRRRRSS